MLGVLLLELQQPVPPYVQSEQMADDGQVAGCEIDVGQGTRQQQLVDEVEEGDDKDEGCEDHRESHEARLVVVSQTPLRA